MGGFAKVVSEILPPVEVTFFRNILGVIIVTISLYKHPLKQKGGKLSLLLFRGFMGFAALLAFFYNIAHIPLATAITYSQTSPIFTSLFAFLLLKEPLKKESVVALAFGFCGVLFIMKPDGLFGFDKYDLLGLFSGVGAALAYTAVKELRKYYDTRAIVLSFMLVGSIFPVLLMTIAEFYTNTELDFMLDRFIMPQGLEWANILFLGLFATLAQILMTKAYGISNASKVATSGYSTIIFSLFIGLYLGDKMLDIYSILGTLLIIIGGVIVGKK
jgi:drug/metabolite transporter (DMT)-like permease